MTTKLQRIWIDDAVLEEIIAEVEIVLPCETGGALLGYRVEARGDFVVADIVGPGPKAVHEACRFVPDYDFQELEIARIYEESGRALNYLGDWHSHPGGGVHLSKKDRRTLRRIARTREARAPTPVMLILAGGPEWSMVGWCARVERRFWWRRLSFDWLEVLPFTPS